MLKSIALILGLPTMLLFDLIANEMGASSGELVAVMEVTSPATALLGSARKASSASSCMDWSQLDAAPTERLNGILCDAIKGWTTPYPALWRSSSPHWGVGIDDEERERRQ